jgi:hypothetical protein
MRHVTIDAVRLVCFGSLVLSLTPLACSSDSTRPEQSESVDGSNAIGLALQIAPGSRGVALAPTP